MTDVQAVSAPGRPRHFTLALVLILLGGTVLRLAYTVAQASTDPWFGHPVLDGRYYVDWSVALASGTPGPAGAFYLAPLYPYVLAGLLRVAGPGFWAIYLVQQGLTVTTAALLAVGGRKPLGGAQSLSAAALLLLYHPILFFAGRPLGETLAILLLVGSLVAAWQATPRGGLVAGFVSGLASLARPNLLLVPLAWSAWDVRQARFRRVAALLLGVASAVLPVTLRNAVVSGRFVPISSNGGLTAFHGNGPGAQGIYTHPAGFPFDLAGQRDAATEVARARSGLDLDPVQADSWWGRQALATRLSRPGETLGLLAWRVALTLGNREFSLDYPPELDPNPLRLTLRFGLGREVPIVPWALLLGLAGAGVVLSGWRGTGGSALWGALLACLATPILFYFSSRYRLPASALLTVPAGVGLVGLVRPVSPHRVPAALVAVVLGLTSMLVPSGTLHRAQLAGGLVNRGAVYLEAGDLGHAESDVRAALDRDPDSPRARLVLGNVLLAAARPAEAEAEYRQAMRLDDLPRVASGLAASLAAQGRFDEAVALLRRELVLHPRSDVCWNALVTVLYAAGDEQAARLAAEQAIRSGVALDPALAGGSHGETHDGAGDVQR